MRLRHISSKKCYRTCTTFINSILCAQQTTLRTNNQELTIQINIISRLHSDNFDLILYLHKLKIKQKVKRDRKREDDIDQLQLQGEKNQFLISR